MDDNKSWTFRERSAAEGINPAVACKMVRSIHHAFIHLSEKHAMFEEG
jgi:hypothetical protein